MALSLFLISKLEKLGTCEGLHLRAQSLGSDGTGMRAALASDHLGSDRPVA